MMVAGPSDLDADTRVAKGHDRKRTGQPGVWANRLLSGHSSGRERPGVRWSRSDEPTSSAPGHNGQSHTRVRPGPPGPPLGSLLRHRSGRGLIIMAVAPQRHGVDHPGAEGTAGPGRGVRDVDHGGAQRRLRAMARSVPVRRHPTAAGAGARQHARGRATGCSTPTGPSTPSATPASSATSRRRRRRRPRADPHRATATGSVDRTGAVTAFGDAAPLGNVDRRLAGPARGPPACRPHRPGRATGSSPTGAGSSPSATRRSSATCRPSRLNGPVLDSVATPTGQGYYMVASDGGIFAFGDAAFAGSMGGSQAQRPRPVPRPRRRRRPATGSSPPTAASSPSTPRSAAPWAATKLNKPVIGMVRYGDGYLMVGADGGIFNFSDRPFPGSLGASPRPSRSSPSPPSQTDAAPPSHRATRDFAT